MYDINENFSFGDRSLLLHYELETWKFKRYAQGIKTDEGKGGIFVSSFTTPGGWGLYSGVCPLKKIKPS